MRHLARFPSIAAGLLAFGVTAPVFAATELCTPVTAFPATLNVPGRYCLRQDVSVATASGALVTITQSDVTFDGNGFHLTNTNPANAATAVFAGNGRLALVVRDLVIDGFHTGISLRASNDPGARLNRISGNVIRRGMLGIDVVGSNNHVLDNRLESMGNANFGGPLGISVKSAYGSDTANVVRGNHLADFRAHNGLPSQGIVVQGRGAVVADNVISGLFAHYESGAGTVGISTGTFSVVEGNIVQSAPLVAAPHSGPQQTGISVGADSVCRNNVVGHFATNIAGPCLQDHNTTW